MRIAGTLSNRSGHDSMDRVVAVGEGRTILAEATMTPEHQWMLEVERPVSGVVAQLKGSRMAATWVSSEATEQIRIPDLLQVDFQFESAIAHARLWIDPVALDGFPDSFLWTLRSHPDGIVDLHVGDFAVTESLRLRMQPGKYRISGGRFSLRPDAMGREEAIRIEHVRNEITGSIIHAEDQEIVLDVCDDDRWRLFFAPGI